MPQLFTEGTPPNAVYFSFPDAWSVVKYDEEGEHFYRQYVEKLGVGLTAVDFVAAPADQTRLWLIEVKDFRGHEVANRKRLTSGDLGVEVMSNFMDTLAGLLAGVHGRDPALSSFAGTLHNPAVEICATLVVATDPLPDQRNAQQLPPGEKKRLAAELEWRSDILKKFKVRLKKPFRFSVYLLDHNQVDARYGWSAA